MLFVSMVVYPLWLGCCLSTTIQPDTPPTFKSPKTPDSVITQGGDRDFVELLVLAQEHSIGVIERACELAVDQKTVRLPAIINLINQLIEPAIDPLPHTQCYPKLTNKPVANCKRYEALYQMRAATV
jgi:hypothetical protein